MQKIIVNADDFGANHFSNLAIEACIKEGLVTSSTIMANGKAFEEAVEIAKKQVNVSYGVHLCIDEFAPLISSEIYRKNGMTDEKGDFIAFSYMNVQKDIELEKVLYEEWKAQILKVRESGVPINHLDSHHHAHIHPLLTPIYIRLANEFGINKVRITLFTPPLIKRKERHSPITLKSVEKKIAKEKVSKVSRFLTGIETYLKLYKTNRKLKRSFDTVDFFCSYRYYLSNKQLLNRFNTIEVMVHPGHPSYDNETNSLVQLKNMKDVVLINY